MEPSVLALPRSPGNYTGDTNACNNQIECDFLLKQSNSAELPIRCQLHSLDTTESAYHSIPQQCPTVLWTVLLLGSKLGRCQLSVRTDHNALNWIWIWTDSRNQPARCRVNLSKPEFDVLHLHIPSNWYMIATKTSENDQTPTDDDILVLGNIPPTAPKSTRKRSWC